MSNPPAKKSPLVPIVAVVVVIAVIALSFAPILTRAYTVPYVTSTITSQASPVALTTTTVETSVISTSAVSAVTSTTTQTASIYSITADTIGVCSGVYQSAQLQTGQAVSVTWSAQAGVDVYLFSQSQFNAYNSSGTTTAMASQTGASSGTIGFIVSFSGTYYMLIHNPSCNNILGFGGSTVGLYSASGTATYPQVVTSYTTSYYNTALLVTSTSYYTTYTTIYGASTYNTTSTTSCTIDLITDLSSSKC